MIGIYEVYIKSHFSAAHSLIGYPGDCAHIHGHNWMVEVYVECKELNEIGIGIDFRDIKQVVKKVIKNLDHSNLNDLPSFENTNPSSENIAKYLYKEVGKVINSDFITVSKVKVCETPSAGALYWEK
jgi:6-pyruvoyltetrahydropterin/6-carboxytetrahydropterin synthase